MLGKVHTPALVQEHILGFASNLQDAEHGGSLAPLPREGAITFYSTIRPYVYSADLSGGDALDARDPQLVLHSVLKPARDVNKMYSAIRGLAAGKCHFMDLEDLGISGDTFASVTAAVDQCTSQVTFGDILGAGWLSEQHWIAGSTRIGVAIQLPRASKWLVSVFSCKDVFGDLLVYEAHRLVSAAMKSDALDVLPPQAIIIPFLEPLRLMTDKGVVFVG